MPKPDPALLEEARYPFHCLIETRYRDLDSNLHINNGVMASLLEEGRVRFHRASNFGGTSQGEGITAFVVSAAIEYLGEARYPEPLEFHLGLLRIGSSSYDLGQLVTQGGEALVFARVTLVFSKNGKSYPIPDHHREEAKEWML